MEPAVLVALAALTASGFTAVATFFASRRTSDDSRTIGLINAGQTALERALERTTAEVLDSRTQVAAMRLELVLVRKDLDGALELHAQCERQRIIDAKELAELRVMFENDRRGKGKSDV